LKDTIDRIVEGKLDLDSGIWENISYEGLDIIKGLLKTDLCERLSCYEAVNHHWFKLSDVKIIKNKFKKRSGIFGDSSEEDFSNITITPRKIKFGLLDFIDSELEEDIYSGNEETSHYFYGVNKDTDNLKNKKNFHLNNSWKSN
jgi:hypothetical protein